MKQGLLNSAHFALTIGAAALLHGCDGSTTISAPSSSAAETGVLIDSAVHGISYRTSSGHAGKTNAAGEFKFEIGDKLVFTLGSLILNEVQAKPVMTPLELFETEDINDPRVVNFVRLIQSMDDDGDINNTITLAEAKVVALETAGVIREHLASSPTVFTTLPSVQHLLQSIDGEELVSSVDALAHFSTTLSSSAKIDSDGDGTANRHDDDDDNDGVADSRDAFPYDRSENNDADGDGTGDNADTDDDNDGIPDTQDPTPYGGTDDFDGDGIKDPLDTDDDNDGVEDSDDAFPKNAAESSDFDRDGTGDNADLDDDNDGVSDGPDAFPLNAAESADNDGDGKGDNADTDDDNDGVTDSADAFPLDATENSDNDEDGTGDRADTDDDNDGAPDNADAFPLDATESNDNDKDGTGDRADTDDDNDGAPDALDAFPLDAAETGDFDNDGVGDNADTDDDNDGITDPQDSLLQVQTPLVNLPPVTAYQYSDERALLFTTHKAEKQLSVLDAVSGDLLATLYFDRMPERMALSPDGHELYVALLDQEHSAYWWNEDQRGAIAVIDTASLSVTRTLSIDLDPYDLAVTAAEKLIVSGGSGQWTRIVALDANTGKLLGNASIDDGSTISLHPSENWVFAADSGSSPSDIEKFDISGSGITSIGDSPYHGDHRMDGNVWPTPDGQHLITRGGDVFLASDMRYVLSLDLGGNGIRIEDAAFDSTAAVSHLLLSSNEVVLLNLDSLEVITSTSHTGTVLALYERKGSIHYLTSTQGRLLLIKTPHPCASCTSNTPPVAQFHYTPTQGSTGDTYSFSATSSYDAEDGSTLLYRWDTDGDGEWDTNYSTASQIDRQFHLTGVKQVTLQVKDSGGQSHTATHSFVVAQGSNTGTEVSDSQAFVMHYNATATLTDAARSRLYTTDKDARRLYVLNTDTGLTERYFDLPTMPENMAVSPDGNTLYVALLSQEHSPYVWGEDQQGYIAVFDLQALSHTRTHELAIDPYGLVVTSQGKLVISSGSGQWTHISAYDAASGTELGRASIRQASNLSLHPSENWLFAADTDFSPSDIEKFDISGTGIASVSDSPYHGDYRMDGNIWATPNGTHLITRGGDVFLASDMSFVESLTSAQIKIEDLAFNTAQQSFSVIGSDNVIYRYDLLTRQLTGSDSQFSEPNFLVDTGSSVYVGNGIQGAIQLELAAF